MRIILRDAQTRKYYCGADKWSTNDTEAKDLRTSACAIELATTVGGEFEVILAFDDPSYNVTMPVFKPLDGGAKPPERRG